MNEEQAKMMVYLNYHHNADEHEINWDTFRDHKMTYYTPNEEMTKVTINPYGDEENEEDSITVC